jgi:hypothetical protein
MVQRNTLMELKNMALLFGIGEALEFAKLSTFEKGGKN